MEAESTSAQALVTQFFPSHRNSRVNAPWEAAGHSKQSPCEDLPRQETQDWVTFPMPWCWPPCKVARLLHVLAFRSQWVEKGLSCLSVLCASTWSLRTNSLAWGTTSLNTPSFVYLLCKLRVCSASIRNPDRGFPSYTTTLSYNNFPGWAGIHPVQLTPHTHPLSS